MGCMGENKTFHYVCCGITLIVLIIVCSLVGIGFSRLEANEMGLDYSANSLSIDLAAPLYDTGLFFLGPGHEFLKFPKLNQFLDMQAGERVIARTKDGLEVDIECRVNYKLAPDEKSMASLYLKFEMEYEKAYFSVSRSVVRDVTADFNAFDFWTKRELIADKIEEELRMKLRDIYANVETFVLTNFELPSQFQQAIIDTDARREELETVEFNREKEIENIDARELQAQEEIRLIKQNGQTTASEAINKYTAGAFRVKTVTEAQVASYGNLKTELNLTEVQLVNLLWLETIATSKADVKYHVPIPSDLMF